MIHFDKPKTADLYNRRYPLLRGFLVPPFQCLTQATVCVSDPDKSIWYKFTDSTQTANLTAMVVGLR